jgi:hypothetical protein
VLHICARNNLFVSKKCNIYLYACVHVSRKETSSEIHTLLAMGKLAENCVCDSSARVRQFLYMHHVFLQLFVPPQRGKKALLVAGGGIKRPKLAVLHPALRT